MNTALFVSMDACRSLIFVARVSSLKMISFVGPTLAIRYLICTTSANLPPPAAAVASASTSAVYSTQDYEAMSTATNYREIITFTTHYKGHISIMTGNISRLLQ